MMITKYRESYEIFHGTEHQPMCKRTTQYLYDTEDARLEHQIVMQKDGYLAGTQKELNIGSLHNPDYRLFEEYTKLERRPDIKLIDKDRVLEILNIHKDIHEIRKAVEQLEIILS